MTAGLTFFVILYGSSYCDGNIERTLLIGICCRHAHEQPSTCKWHTPEPTCISDQTRATCMIGCGVPVFHVCPAGVRLNHDVEGFHIRQWDRPRLQQRSITGVIS